MKLEDSEGLNPEEVNTVIAKARQGGKNQVNPNLPRNRAERRAAMKTQLTRKQRLDWKNRKRLA